MSNDQSRPKSLVTGGAGFIGSHVADALIASGHDVVVLDDLSTGFLDNINPRTEFVQASVNDSALIESLFERHKFDYVFHLAAYAAEGLSHFIRRFNYTNNVLGSVTLINAAIRHRCRCLVFTSSIAVYGGQQTPMVEDMVPEPEDPYGIAKYAVELDLAAARRFFGIDYIVFRPHNVYGERQNIADKYRNVIGIFMNQLMQGLPCTIFGDGDTNPGIHAHRRCCWGDQPFDFQPSGLQPGVQHRRRHSLHRQRPGGKSPTPHGANIPALSFWLPETK